MLFFVFMTLSLFNSYLHAMAPNQQKFQQAITQILTNNHNLTQQFNTITQLSEKCTLLSSKINRISSSDFYFPMHINLARNISAKCFICNKELVTDDTVTFANLNPENPEINHIKCLSNQYNIYSCKKFYLTDINLESNQIEQFCSQFINKYQVNYPYKYYYLSSEVIIEFSAIALFASMCFMIKSMSYHHKEIEDSDKEFFFSQALALLGSLLTIALDKDHLSSIRIIHHWIAFCNIKNPLINNNEYHLQANRNFAVSTVCAFYCLTYLIYNSIWLTIFNNNIDPKFIEQCNEFELRNN